MTILYSGTDREEEGEQALQPKDDDFLSYPGWLLLEGVQLSENDCSELSPMS